MVSEAWQAYEMRQRLAQLTEVAAAAIAKRDALASVMHDMGMDDE